MSEGYTLDRPLSLSCPECGGVMREEATGELQQFRCHIGHVLTAEAMLAAQFSKLEWSLASALALFNERAELCRRMAEQARLTQEAEACRLTLLSSSEALERMRADVSRLEQEQAQQHGSVRPVNRDAGEPESLLVPVRAPTTHYHASG